MNSVFFLLLRRMRAPLIFVILSHAVAVLGLTLIPGADTNGQPAPPLDFFHAFYFITYTATTIGYTEPVSGFSDAQRLWITACIYLLVVSWSFVIVTLLACLQDKGLQNALVSGRFIRRLRRLNEPFYLICGYGETGSLVCRALDHLDQRFVILEKDELRVQELELEDYKADIIALAADARQPDNLLQAGLRHRRCRGVLALTNDESTNLAVAMAVRLLNPAIPILARARSGSIAANMASFRTDHVINPFERFAEYLSLAAAAPERFRLVELLTGLPGAALPDSHRPPRGRWIVCGYGIFGQAVVSNLEATGITVTIVDPRAEPGNGVSAIRGRGADAATLEAAGIRDAEGIVAGSDDDVSNLAIAVTARELNPDLFVVTRQNLAANGALFDAFIGDFCMVPSRIVAQECLAILTTPMLARFLQRLRECDESWSARLVARLQAACADRVPEVWSVCLDARDAAAVHHCLTLGRAIRLGELMVDNVDRSEAMPMVPLLLERDGRSQLLPAADFPLAAGDHLLLAGPHGARRRFELTLQNNNAMEYVLSGREAGGGWLWQWISGARG
ncbi:potassium transporter TrkA [Denitratisoma sp. DHT3]|uniref:potassium channel family protein n=1 Tax=Denitratisoma sp. DHT3 TaxID=1981880 RepID=UPI0011983E63|nr:NAD-binding protein [Denitratisoma sp. DHT3]QDX80342.1 potassium transporter TrkA [Denitratisoma sp. DHT3]